jgi:hypothetical protein
MEKLIAALVIMLGMVGLALFIGFLLAWPVMMLWNGCLVDAVTIVKPIGWLQAWGITILASFLFKSTSSK